jgi:hypothetical protein
MRCSNCDFENIAGKKFCIRCGSAFITHCPKCGCENPPEASFCGDCGADLSEPVPAPRQPNLAAATVAIERGAQHDTPEGERRHLTVLFCDLVGSTEIASHLDPEEWREIVGEYHRAAAQAIERFGGNVAQYLGDGVMAYFGWPEAHDNDAERAARAGLAILDAISKLNENPTHPKLAARVGIDSGAVVVGAGAGGRRIRRHAQYRRARAGRGGAGHLGYHPTRCIGWSPACSWSRIAERRRSRG